MSDSEYEQHQKWRTSMREFIRDANEHFKNHQQGTVMGILSTIVTGIVASGVLNVSAWASTIGGLLILFLMTAWPAWSESRIKLKKLEQIINDAGKVSEIQTALASYITQGNNLYYRSFHENGESFVKECKIWDLDVSAFLKSRLNPYAVACFSHPDYDDVDAKIQEPSFTNA